VSSFERPGDDDDAGDVDLASEVDHPDGSVGVEVVEDGARVERRAGDAVDGAPGVTVLPASAHMSLHVTSTARPRLLVVRHVLHYTPTHRQQLTYHGRL